MAQKQQPTILIIIGITGDLSRRYLLPAIDQILKVGAAPEQFHIVGISRRDVTPAEVLASPYGEIAYEHLAPCLSMYQMDLTSKDAYRGLSEYIANIEQSFGSSAQRLFYLSVPPQISQPVIELLGQSGLAHGDTKLLLEKPFGTDLLSARELVTETKKHFKEDQIYRIDHYLAKEMAQNFVVFRAGNTLFNRTWNKDFIERVEIVVKETIGIEGRAAFYEQTGALRDMVQSHLLQLAALTLMKTPPPGQLHEVPACRLEALRQLRLPPDKLAAEQVKRGQYRGYREEVGNNDTSVETYVSLNLMSADPEWAGVSINLTTGKALDQKTTEIRVTYKTTDGYGANQLTLHLQPNEGIKLSLWTKVPGYEKRVENRSMELAFRDHFGELPEAYEQVLVDAINSSHALFTTSEEVLETWRILEPVQAAWEMSALGLVIYEKGSEAV